MAYQPEELRILHKACREGDRHAVEIATSKMPPALVNRMSPVTGRTAFHEACASGQVKLVEILIQAGADRERVTFIGEDAPLHLAIASGNRSLVLVLLQQGCDPNKPNRFGATPFHYVSKPSIAKLLLRYGGDLTIRDKFGETPWDRVYQAYPGNRELSRLLGKAWEEQELQRLQERFAGVKAESEHIQELKQEELRRIEAERQKHQSKEMTEFLTRQRQKKNQK